MHVGGLGRDVVSQVLGNVAGGYSISKNCLEYFLLYGIWLATQSTVSQRWPSAVSNTSLSTTRKSMFLQPQNVDYEPNESVTGIQLESGAREETGRFRDVKRCVATEDRTRVSGISLLRHNR